MWRMSRRATAETSTDKPAVYLANRAQETGLDFTKGSARGTAVAERYTQVRELEDGRQDLRDWFGRVWKLRDDARAVARRPPELAKASPHVARALEDAISAMEAAAMAASKLRLVVDSITGGKRERGDHRDRALDAAVAMIEAMGMPAKYAHGVAVGVLHEHEVPGFEDWRAKVDSTRQRRGTERNQPEI
jgi:hypothetical protein